MKAPVILLAIVVIIGALAALVALAKKSGPSGKWPVKPRAPVSKVEQLFYRRLIEAFPENIILCQVAVSQLVSVDRVPGQQAFFNRLARLVADFVVLSPDFRVVGIIELDDRSHQAEHRQRADANKTAALTSAGYVLRRYQASALPTVAELKQALTTRP